ncbi:MAG: hypothetical protein LIO78_07895 [Clostridiales bacterium]|nr:hypothetical protein [Clostridiales bacterium]
MSIFNQLSPSEVTNRITNAFSGDKNRRPSETEKLLARLDEASAVMGEVELLLDEIAKCEEKLDELDLALKHPAKKSRIPILRHVLNATSNTDEAEVKSQILAYRSMLAGLNGHLLQIVLHQCKDFLFLGDYLYPVAVSELKSYLSTGNAQTLEEALGLYEANLARWRSGTTEQGRVRRADEQARRMAKVLKEARTM